MGVGGGGREPNRVELRGEGGGGLRGVGGRVAEAGEKRVEGRPVARPKRRRLPKPPHTIVHRTKRTWVNIRFFARTHARTHARTARDHL